MDDDPDVAAIVCLLAKYLLANPLACDTADGIRRWWLPAEPVPIDTVLATLSWMKRQTLIEEMIAADGRMRYRRCATDADIEAVVERFRRNPRTRH